MLASLLLQVAAVTVYDDVVPVVSATAVDYAVSNVLHGVPAVPGVACLPAVADSLLYLASMLLLAFPAENEILLLLTPPLFFVLPMDEGYLLL